VDVLSPALKPARLQQSCNKAQKVCRACIALPASDCMKWCSFTRGNDYSTSTTNGTAYPSHGTDQDGIEVSATTTMKRPWFSGGKQDPSSFMSCFGSAMELSVSCGYTKACPRDTAQKRRLGYSFLNADRSNMSKRTCSYWSHRTIDQCP
jgi:hypothetical protein